jgi:hypothetical protein
VTTLRGTNRSTETREADGSGDTIGEARAAATGALDLDGFQLLQVVTVESKATGESTVRATARSTSTQTHEASGPNYPAALARSTRPSPTAGRRSTSTKSPTELGLTCPDGACTASGTSARMSA